MHSFLGVPVVLAGRPVGNLYLTEKIGATRFSEADQRLVETFARQAAMAIHTARLHEGLGRLALLQERERIGRDLHDGIIQALYGVGLSLEDVPELMALDRAEAEVRVDRAIDSIHATIRDIRGFIFGLRTDDFESVELRPGLERLAAELARGTSMTVDVEVAEEPELDPTRRPPRAPAGPRGAQQRRSPFGRRPRRGARGGHGPAASRCASPMTDTGSTRRSSACPVTRASATCGHAPSRWVAPLTSSASSAQGRR